MLLLLLANWSGNSMPKNKKKMQDADILINKPNVRATRIVHDSDKVTHIRKAVRIKNPFKKNKNVYTMITKKHYDKEEDKAWKSTYTKIGEKKPGKLRSKTISKDKVMKAYQKTNKRIKKKKKKNALLNALKRSINKKKKGY